MQLTHFKKILFYLKIRITNQESKFTPINDILNTVITNNSLHYRFD